MLLAVILKYTFDLRHNGDEFLKGNYEFFKMNSVPGASESSYLFFEILRLPERKIFRFFCLIPFFFFFPVYLSLVSLQLVALHCEETLLSKSGVNKLSKNPYGKK